MAIRRTIPLRGRPSPEAYPPEKRPLPLEGPALANPSHALRLQAEYDEWRERLGLNPTRWQVRKLKGLAIELAQATGEVAF